MIPFIHLPSFGMALSFGSETFCGIFVISFAVSFSLFETAATYMFTASNFKSRNWFFFLRKNIASSKVIKKRFPFRKQIKYDSQDYLNSMQPELFSGKLRK